MSDTLWRALADPTFLRDRSQLPQVGPIKVRSEVLTPGEGYLLDAATLPVTRERAIELRTQSELQLLADQQAQPLYFIVLDGAVMTYDEASVRVGVDFVTPQGQVAAPNACCWCREELTYRKNGDGWEMVSRGPCTEPRVRPPTKNPAAPPPAKPRPTRKRTR